MRTVITIGLAVAAISVLWAQSPRFEVATVKPNRTGSGASNLPRISNGRLAAQNASLSQILEVACGLSALEIRGPDWLDSGRFDLAGTAPQGIPDSEFMPMLQSLLKERFHLLAHRENREMPVYDLIVAKEGLKIPAFDPSHRPPPPRRNGADAMIIGPMTMARLAHALARPVGRPVINRTGVDGRYFCVVTYSPITADARGSSADGGLDIFAALPQQTGLKLEPKKETLEILVVDHAERTPTEN